MIQAFLFNGFYECMLVGALFLVVHMVLGNILEPRMMGHRLGMSTLVVFLLVSGTDSSIPTGPSSHPQISKDKNTTSVDMPSRWPIIDDGPPAGHVDAGGVLILTDLGMAAGPGWDAAVGTAHQ